MARTAGVFKRGKTYWLRYSIAGRQYRESAKTSVKEQAEALLHKRQNDIFEGRFFPDRKSGDLTMDGLKNMWLEAAAGKASVKHDEQRLKRIVAHFKARTLISTITSEQIDAFKKTLAKTPTRFGDGFKPATINRHLAVLRAAFRLADRRGYKHRNPLAGVRFLDEDNERDRICTADEYARLMAAADAELRLAIVFGYWTGMRLGEIAGLSWKQVSLKTGMI